MPLFSKINPRAVNHPEEHCFYNARALWPAFTGITSSWDIFREGLGSTEFFGATRHGLALDEYSSIYLSLVAQVAGWVIGN